MEIKVSCLKNIKMEGSDYAEYAGYVCEIVREFIINTEDWVDYGRIDSDQQMEYARKIAETLCDCDSTIAELI